MSSPPAAALVLLYPTRKGLGGPSAAYRNWEEFYFNFKRILRTIERMPGGGRRRGSREAVGDEPAVVVVAPAVRKGLPPSLFTYHAIMKINYPSNDRTLKLLPRDCQRIMAAAAAGPPRRLRPGWRTAACCCDGRLRIRRRAPRRRPPPPPVGCGKASYRRRPRRRRRLSCSRRRSFGGAGASGHLGGGGGRRTT